MIAGCVDTLYCPHCSRTLSATEQGFHCENCQYLFPVVDGIVSLMTEEGNQDGFHPEVFELLSRAEASYFWFIGRREIIVETLKRQIPQLAGRCMLEIGCGHGSLLDYLGQETPLMLAGADMFLEGLRLSRQRLQVPLYQVNATQLPFRNCFDVIGLFDMLEHADDDGQVLRECWKALGTQGRLMLTVPAFRALWSPFDELSCHKRRYTRPELVKKLADAGFIIDRLSYFMCVLFPVVYCARVVKRWIIPSRGSVLEQLATELRIPPLINGACLHILRFERWLMRYIDLPWGVSLLVVARKQERGAA